MVTSMLADFREGWLSMWKNTVVIDSPFSKVGTHADLLIAEAVVKGVQGFDWEEAVWQDATNGDYEVWAGLSSVYGIKNKSWVVDDIHLESASRMSDYAYNDYTAYKLSIVLGKLLDVTSFLLEHAMHTPFTLFNADTRFMEARNQDGTWTGEDHGWTKGNKLAYSFDIVHDILGLIQKRGGDASFVKSFDTHFNGGYNDHTNKPSHHIPYLYSLAGAAYKTQEHVHKITQENYNNTPTGLSGVTIDLPPQHHLSKADRGKKWILRIIAKDAPSKSYNKSLTINGRKTNVPIMQHKDITNGASIHDNSIIAAALS
ncbi:hypothetical protein L208DRAFT_1380994 [Tricholoma matsutake]|nr:hypothetical protein L208DRAFT_1380994 [Tricholoma matsutake 945]